MSFQCYFIDDNNKRCKQEQENYWCSKEHEDLWRQENYKDMRLRKERQLPIKEIQKRLLIYALKKREERFKTQQKLL